MSFKSWRPVLDDINAEITRLTSSVANAPFNNDFSHCVHVAKTRAHELEQRLLILQKEMRAEAAAQREIINALMGDFYRGISDAEAALARFRVLRADRARANYLHIQELKARAAEEGGEE